MFKDIKTGIIIHADLENTVSRATHRPQDLIPSFLEVIKNTPEYLQLNQVLPYHIQHDENSMWYESEDCAYFMEELFNVLDLYAPEGFYFGAHEGDGSDFGYWKMEESSMFHGSPASQIFN